MGVLGVCVTTDLMGTYVLGWGMYTAASNRGVLSCVATAVATGLSTGMGIAFAATTEPESAPAVRTMVLTAIPSPIVAAFLVLSVRWFFASFTLLFGITCGSPWSQA